MIRPTRYSEEHLLLRWLIVSGSSQPDCALAARALAARALVARDRCRGECRQSLAVQRGRGSSPRARADTARRAQARLPD